MYKEVLGKWQEGWMDKLIHIWESIWVNRWMCEWIAGGWMCG